MLSLNTLNTPPTIDHPFPIKPHPLKKFFKSSPFHKIDEMCLLPPSNKDRNYVAQWVPHMRRVNTETELNSVKFKAIKERNKTAKKRYNFTLISF